MCHALEVMTTEYRIAIWRWIITTRTVCAGLRWWKRWPLQDRRVVSSLSRRVPWAELLYSKLEVKFATELEDAASQRGRMFCCSIICYASEKSHPILTGLAGHIWFSVHRIDKGNSGFWWYLCWRQSRHPFSVTTLKHPIKINCLENTSFLLVDWWTRVSLYKQKEQKWLVSKWSYVNLLTKNSPKIVLRIILM